MTLSINSQHVIGPLGSDFWYIKVPPALVPKMARELDWNKIGRRVMIDALEGIILLMSPSSSHEVYAESSGTIVKKAGSVLQKQVRGMLGTRWKKPEDPENVGLEADASFYIGENAHAWYNAAKTNGEKAVLAFVIQTPPDLVIEVEVTHFDQDKPTRYARLGVPEMWRVNARKGIENVQVEFLNLQAQDGPIPIQESRVLEGLMCSDLTRAYQLAYYGDNNELDDWLEAKILPAT
ncbi:MAG: Uma2 family endonuclease [Aestuariivita sp.]|nr:Uma2 family endonuclease [Aestuariivita sp.]